MKHLTERQRLILYILTQQEWVTAKELSVHLDVSVRSIKNDIKQIRELMNVEDEMIISKPGTGYALNKEVKSLSFLEDDRVIQHMENIYRYTRSNSDRVSFLVLRFLLEEDYQKITDLSSILYVSDATVHQDLQDVREMLAIYDLHLDSKPFYGLILKGKETDIQTALLDFIFYNRLSLVDESLYRYFFYQKPSHLSKMMDIVNHKALKYQEKYASWIVENIVYVCLICLRRSKFQALRKEDLLLENIRYQFLAEEIVEEMHALLGIKNHLREEDYLWIASHLESKRTLTIEEPLSPSVRLLTKQIYHEIYNNFNLDFSQNTVLFDATCRHLSQVLQRYNRKIFLKNKTLKNQLGKHLFALKITISAMDIISQAIPGFGLNTDETAYLMMHFQYGITLEKRSETSRHIYFIDDFVEIYKLHYGNEIKRYYENKGHHVAIGNTYSNKEYDLVIAMRDYYSESKNILLLDHNNYMQQISRALTQLDFSKEQLHQFIKEDYVLTHLSGRNKEEVMQSFYQRLKELELLKKKETENPFIAHEIGQSVMHVHDLKKVVDHSVCVVGLLETPIISHQGMIKVIFMIKTKRDEDQFLYFLCDIFSLWASNPMLIETFYNKPSFKLLKTQLDEIIDQL